MSIEPCRISVGDIEVDVVRKRIKNLHLGVYPPLGRVRVAAPEGVSNEAVRLAIITRLPWIKRQRAKFAAQMRQSERAYLSGETHFHFGQRYRLRVVERRGAGSVKLAHGDRIELTVPPGSDGAYREKIVQGWQRRELRARAEPLIDKWAEAMGEFRPKLGIKRMKTLWGSCNPSSRRIWLNLELAKKASDCIEYLVIHEMAHFTEPNHGERFVALMDRYMLRWRIVRDELNSAPLAHEDWDY